MDRRYHIHYTVGKKKSLSLKLFHIIFFFFSSIHTGKKSESFPQSPTDLY